MPSLMLSADNTTATQSNEDEQMSVPERDPNGKYCAVVVFWATKATLCKALQVKFMLRDCGKD